MQGDKAEFGRRVAHEIVFEPKKAEKLKGMSIMLRSIAEIARRVFASCRRRGISTVAVFSDADAEALAAQLADSLGALERLYEATLTWFHALADHVAAGEAVLDVILETGFLSHVEEMGGGCAARSSR